MSKVKTTVLKGIWKDHELGKNPVIRVELIEGWTLTRILELLERTQYPRIQPTVGFKLPSYHIQEEELQLGAVISAQTGRIKPCSRTAVHASTTAYHRSASSKSNHKKKTVWLVYMKDARPADYTKWYGKSYTVIGKITVATPLRHLQGPSSRKAYQHSSGWIPVHIGIRLLHDETT